MVRQPSIGGHNKGFNHQMSIPKVGDGFMEVSIG
jgi:hypothetical protein